MATIVGHRTRRNTPEHVPFFFFSIYMSFHGSKIIAVRFCMRVSTPSLDFVFSDTRVLWRRSAAIMRSTRQRWGRRGQRWVRGATTHPHEVGIACKPMVPPQAPMFFIKPNSSVIHAPCAIEIPRGVGEVQHEVCVQSPARRQAQGPTAISGGGRAATG